MKTMKINSKNGKKFPVNLVIKGSLFTAVLVILIVIFSFGIRPYKVAFHEGDIAVKDIFAPFDFTYYGDVDEDVTEELRRNIAVQVRIVYDFDEEARKMPSVHVKDFFEKLESFKKENIALEEQAEKLKERFLELKENHVVTLLDAEDLQEIKVSIAEIIDQIGATPIIARAEREGLIREMNPEIALRDLKEKDEKAVKISKLLLADNIQRSLLNNLVNKYFKENHKLKAAVSDLLKGGVVANIKKNSEESLKRKNEARANVQEVLKEIDVKKNEIILGRGERVKKHHISQLEKIFGKELNRREKVSLPVSMAVIILLLLAITVVTLKRYGPKIYNNNSYLLLIAIISIALLSGARLITVSFLSSYFIPIAAASMLIAILLTENVAFLITLMLSIGCGIIVGNKLEMMIICLIGGAVGVYAVRGLRKRFQLLKAGSLVGCANFIIIASFGFLTSLEANIFLIEAGKGLLSGIMSSFIVMGLLPVFESLFKITTDITLLELSDLNHPLLKALTLKAPGTYHHSLLVGNLAEAACDAIGANSLLARVGSYYHDIGKVEKAEYFGENIVEGKLQQHDKISPSMSALVITNHVKDGVELARRHKLNQSIIDFIEQHHGNTLIYYFYQRALEKVVDDTQLEEEDFRYPGPKPQTKETATVLLADAVEASSRTLSKPTPARIEGLVRKIINNKFIDGQLDECELTLKDLNKIAVSFVRVLMGVFHSRVEYPEAEQKSRVKNKNKEIKKKLYLRQPTFKKNNKQDT